MDINNIDHFFYSQIHDGNNFCSFMKQIKSDSKIFNKLSENLAKKILPFKKDIDLLISVPKFYDEINEPDYSKDLAEIISETANIPYDSKFITKIKKTRKLKTVPVADRSEEIKSAFQIKGSANTEKRICVIDDVISSGNTLKEIIKTLSLNNFKNISIAALIVQRF